MISYVDLFHRIYSILSEKKSNAFQLLTYDNFQFSYNKYKCLRLSEIN